MAQRDTSGKLATPLMILAFLSAAGLLYWLNVTSAPAEFTVAQEASQGDEVRLVEVGDFAADPAALMGQRIRLSQVFVASVTSPEVVWFEFEDGTRYLVRISRELVDDGFRVLEGELVGFEGTIQQMNESVAENWLADGVINDPALRDTVAALQSYLFAEQVHVGAAVGAGESN